MTFKAQNYEINMKLQQNEKKSQKKNVTLPLI